MIQHDPLLDKISKLQAQQIERDFNRKKALSEETSTRVSEKLSLFHRMFAKMFSFAGGLLSVFIWIFEHLIQPVFGRIISITKNLWNKFVYKDDKFGNPRFIIYRAGVFILALMVSWSLIFVALDLTYYTSLYLLTAQKDEVVYMTNSQEVDPSRDTYSAQGCESLPCDQNSSIYFRVDPILFNHIYTVFHNGGIFYPDYVAAAIPPTLTKCTITSYGVRIKTLMRGLDIYPYLLEASCQPVIEK